MIGPPYMKKVFANYANWILRQTSGTKTVYDPNLQLFTDNINDYFLGSDQVRAWHKTDKQYAMNAIQNANDLEEDIRTSNAVKKKLKLTT